MDLRNLPIQETLAEGITLGDFNGLPVIRIDHPAAEAGICLHGGHLLWFKPRGERDLIWLSDKAVFQSDKAIRGGIPVCWPWFGGLGGTPSHGFARISRWQLEQCSATPDHAEVVLSLGDNETTHAIWPHAFSNQLRFHIGEQLSVALTSTNTDTTAWTYSGALHSYFQIGDITQTQVEGADSHYLDSVAGGVPTEGNGKVRFAGEVDRVYTRPEASLTIQEPAQDNPIRVDIQGGDAAVIWNPGPELSASMADMADDGYRTMVCVEAAIHQVPITLQPGQSHTLTTQIGLGLVD